jgi:hypothetical protein
LLEATSTSLFFNFLQSIISWWMHRLVRWDWQSRVLKLCIVVHHWNCPKSNPWHPHHRGRKLSDSEWGSGPPKPRCEVLCQALHGTWVVVTAVLSEIPSGHWAATCHMNAFHLWLFSMVLMEW